MVSDILVVVGAILVPLVVRPRWLVVVLSLVCAATAATLSWQAGLEQDVPPIMLVFACAVLAPVTVGVALAVHALKTWCLRRFAEGAERK